MTLSKKLRETLETLRLRKNNIVIFLKNAFKVPQKK